jgi:ABC-type glycerol-3-phosphate transport system permease component
MLAHPAEVEEAALVDGASRWRAFFRILLPMLSPGLLAAGVITFAQMAAMGVVSALIPVGLLMIARRYAVSALTFGAVREKA